MTTVQAVLDEIREQPGNGDRRLGAVSLLPASERNPLLLSLEGGQIGCRPG